MNPHPLFGVDVGTDGAADLSSLDALGLFTVDVQSLLSELNSCASHYRRGSIRMDKIPATATALTESMSSETGTEAAAKPFLELLDAELARVSNCHRSRVDEVTASALVLLNATDGALSRVRSGNEEGVRYRKIAELLSSTCMSMRLYTRTCYYEFEPIATKADKTFCIGSKCMEMVHKAMMVKPGGDLIGILSAAYRNIRVIEEMGGVGGSDLVLDSFDSMKLKRRSHKFLVKYEKIVDLMMAVIAEVPLTVFGMFL